MVITYQGNQCFKLQFGDTTIAFNPIAKDSSFKSARFGANVCLISINHPDFNGSDQVSFGDKQPFVISGPGEYEVQGVFIKGFPSSSHYTNKDSKEDKKEFVNTIYTLTFDSINVCFLGALDSKDLSSETKEAIDDVDMLFVPIGGSGVLSAEDAYKVAVALEPKIIIPMGFDGVTSKDSLKLFLKEGSGEGTKPVDKLTVKRKDLEGKEGEIVVMSVS